MGAALMRIPKLIDSPIAAARPGMVRQLRAVFRYCVGPSVYDCRKAGQGNDAQKDEQEKERVNSLMCHLLGCHVASLGGAGSGCQWVTAMPNDDHLFSMAR